MRQAIQLTSFQNKIMKSIINFKQLQIQERTLKYKIQEQSTDLLYLEVAKIEAPVEHQLQTNIKLSKMKQCLDEQCDLLR